MLTHKVYKKLNLFMTMVRGRVIGIFIGLMLFTLVIFLIQLNTEQSFTGSIVQDARLKMSDSKDVGEGFSLDIDSYDIRSNFIDVSYSVKDNSGDNHELEINYFIHDEATKVIKSGRENVLLQAGKEMDYTLSIPFNKEVKDSLFLTILADDGINERRARVPITVSSGSITGSTIGEDKITATNYFFVMFIALAVLFYCVRAIYSYRLGKKISNNGNDRFISIHH